MNILRKSKPQEWRKFKKISLKQSLLGLTKKKKNFVNNKLKIYNCTQDVKNTLTSSSQANFRLDIYHFKTLLHSFWRRKNGLKTDKICKLFSHLNICLHYNIFIRLQIAYERTHLTLGSCTSVKCIQLLVKFYLIV